MARSVYIMCDDCNKEYCVNLVEKNKSLKQTSYLAEAEFVLKHGDLSDFQKRQLEPSIWKNHPDPSRSFRDPSKKRLKSQRNQL